MRSDEIASDLEAQTAPMLEFVTITGQPTTKNSPKISKQVRTQAMRDYLWKHKQGRGEANTLESVRPEEPSKYKGRFKLDSWSHKTKTKAKNKQQVHSGNDTNAVHLIRALGEGAYMVRSPSPGLSFSFRAGLDPFNTLAVPLLPSSDRILKHCELSVFLDLALSLKSSKRAMCGGTLNAN